MPSYPPAIKFRNFADQPIATVGKPQWNAFVARARYESSKRNRVAVHACGIEDLWLAAGAARSTENFRESHALEVGPTSAKRWHFAPIAEAVNIHWELSGFAHIHTLILQLYRRGDAQALWEKTITWLPGACPQFGHTPFNGSLENTVPLQAATAANAVNIVTHHAPPDFPDDCVNIEFSPYKLRATIPPDPNLRRTPPSRFLYFDILVADITLALGPAVMIPAAPISAAQLALHQNTHARMTADGGLPAAGATRRVVLKSNVFKMAGGAVAELHNNSGHDQYQIMWGDGPQIPIEATVRIRDSANHPVAAPLALGNAKFLWDWKDVDKNPNARQIAGQLAPARYLATTYDYDARTTQPPGTNCHVDRGGKRGPGAAPVFPPQVGYVGAALLANQFPYPVQACVHRTWAAISRPRTTGVCAGKTGVIFSPSRMAGDAYELAVYFAYDKDAAGNPVLDAAGALNAAHCVQQATGTFEVWRKVEIVRYLVKTAGVPNFLTPANIAFVQERYASAFVEMDFVHGAVAPMNGVINQATYNGFVAGPIANGIVNDPKLDLLIDPAANHWVAPSLYQTRTFAQYQVAVQTFLDNVHATVGTATAALNLEGNAAPSPLQIQQKRDAMKLAWMNAHGAANELSFVNKVSGPCSVMAQQIVQQLDVFAGLVAGQTGIVVLQYEWQITALRDYVNGGHPPDFNAPAQPYSLVAGTAIPSNHATRERCAFMLYAPHPETFSHEIGHHLFLCHNSANHGENQRHDMHHDINAPGQGINCLMQDRDRPRPGFCGLCQLKLRGWSLGAGFPPLLNRDAALNRRP